MRCKLLCNIMSFSVCKIKLLFLNQWLIFLGRGKVLKKISDCKVWGAQLVRAKKNFLSPHTVTFKTEHFQSIFCNPCTNKLYDYYCTHVCISFWLNRSWMIFTLILDHQSEEVKKHCTRKRNPFLKPKPTLI